MHRADNHKRAIALSVLTVVALIGIVGCAADESLVQARNTLMAADASYEAAWQAFLDAHTRGLISDEDLKRGFQAAKAYEFAWNEATRAYGLYVENLGQEAKTQAVVALTEASRALGELIGFVNTFVDAEVKP